MQSTAFPQKNVNKWESRRLHVLCQLNTTADWYKNEKKYQHINGLGTMEGIFADICEAVDGL